MNDQFNKHNFLPIEAKQIILNVFTVLKELANGDHKGLITQTAELTKTPYATVWSIVNQGIIPRKRRHDSGKFRMLDEVYDADLVRRTIYDLYNQKTVPTVDILYRRLYEENRITCSETTLRRFIKKNGFSYKKINKRMVIMESEKIRKLRYEYLKTIQKYRDEKRPIFFLDETWYDTHDVAEKGWTDGSRKCVIDVPVSKGQRIIILNAGSAEGWVHEDTLLLSAKNIKDSKVDYHENMSSSIFENWFERKLLPKLPPHSVVVMDNASYHSRLKQKVPNSASTRAELMEFLLENDLYFEETYRKRELLEVLKTKTYQKQFIVDKLAEDYGHTILKLPPYYCIFNPIELIWSQLKAHVRRNNKNPKFSKGSIELIIKEVQEIKAEAWRKCVERVFEIEETYRKNHVQELIIHVDSDDESSECED